MVLVVPFGHQTSSAEVVSAEHTHAFYRAVANTLGLAVALNQQEQTL